LDATEAALVPTATGSLARATLSGFAEPDAELAEDPAAPRFQLLREVGRGGLGEVFVADDRDIGRQVAIKRVRIDRRSADAVQRFVQEVRTTGQLDHPNIVPLHDVGRDEDGGFYYVMKYLEGESLEALIARLRAGDREAHATWTFERRVALFRDVLQAIRFAHARGVVHRDIKPANVMVGACGEVHVVDWGLAKQLRDAGGSTGADAPPAAPPEGRTSLETRQGAMIGTPLYMAPEQVRREAADERTDVWQLCLVFHELLSLRHYLDDEAFREGAPPEADLDRILTGVLEREIPNATAVRSPHQPPVPVELGHIVARGLQRDPAARWQSVAALIRALDRRAEGEFDVHCPLTMQKWALHRALKWLDRHPGLGWVSVLGIVTAAGAALFGAFGLGLLAFVVLWG
jgi:eukaryotic-like serine/threonine-protein kinase